jgi:hypothetical protein
MGLGKGTLPFFSNGANGIFGFSARLWATAGQTVAILSLDSEYRQWHRNRIVNEATNLNRVWKRRGVKSLHEIVFQPFADVALGVTMGATGLLHGTLRWREEGGTRRYAQGVAVGTIGVVAKPVIGVFDAFTHVSQTVHDLAKSVNVLERRYEPALKLRLPYVFGPMNILCPFDAVSARSVFLLSISPPRTKLKRRLHMGKSMYTVKYSRWSRVWKHMSLPLPFELFSLRSVKITKQRFCTIFGWEVDLSGPSRVSAAVSDHGHHEVALTITTRAPPRQSNTKSTRRSSLMREKHISTKRSNASFAVNASSLLSVASSELSEGEEEIFEPDESYEICNHRATGLRKNPKSKCCWPKSMMMMELVTI